MIVFCEPDGGFEAFGRYVNAADAFSMRRTRQTECRTGKAKHERQKLMSALALYLCFFLIVLCPLLDTPTCDANKIPRLAGGERESNARIFSSPRRMTYNHNFLFRRCATFPPRAPSRLLRMKYDAEGITTVSPNGVSFFIVASRRRKNGFSLSFSAHN